MRQVTYLTPNETETGIICSIGVEQVNPSTASEIARRLVSRGLRHVLIKMGSQGAYAATAQNDGVLLPPFKVQVVDSTAAGDAFNGGLPVALVRGLDSVSAARFASAVAALSVTRMGAQPSIPAAREVKRFVTRWSGPEVAQLLGES